MWRIVSLNQVVQCKQVVRVEKADAQKERSSPSSLSGPAVFRPKSRRIPLSFSGTDTVHPPITYIPNLPGGFRDSIEHQTLTMARKTCGCPGRAPANSEWKARCFMNHVNKETGILLEFHEELEEISAILTQYTKIRAAPRDFHEWMSASRELYAWKDEHRKVQRIRDRKIKKTWKPHRENHTR